MSDTPRVDEIAKPIEDGTGYECDAIALLNLARQLERELAEAHGHLSGTIRTANEEMDRHKAELAEAKQEYEKLLKLYRSEEVRHDAFYWRQCWEKAEAEKQQALAECEIMKKIILDAELMSETVLNYTLSTTAKDI